VRVAQLQEAPRSRSEERQLLSRRRQQDINSSKAPSKVKMFTPDVWHRSSERSNFCALARPPIFLRWARSWIYKLFACAVAERRKRCRRCGLAHCMVMHNTWHIRAAKTLLATRMMDAHCLILTSTCVPVGGVVDVVVDVCDVPEIAWNQKEGHCI